MATSLPRPKIFGATTTKSPFIVFMICTFFALSMSGIFNLASCEVALEPDFIKVNEFPDHNHQSRVERSFIPLGDDASSSYNNPNVLEGGGTKDAYETLRQLSLASTQPFIRRRLFNTSVALTVPLFSFTLPQRAAEGSTVDLANQAIFGLFALLVVMMVFAVPVLFTGIRPFDLEGRSNKEDQSQVILDNLMKSDRMINLMGADMKNKIGLNPDQCLQKSICDAHRHPKKYGLFALPFQIFFPPPVPGKQDRKSYSKYQMAAQTGEYTKSECWAKYNCFFDPLDLALYFVDWFNSTKIPEELDETQTNM